MAKVLTMTPAEGESKEEFAGRVAAQVQQFFGDADEAEEAPTDVPAESETAPEEPPPEG